MNRWAASVLVLFLSVTAASADMQEFDCVITESLPVNPKPAVYAGLLTLNIKESQSDSEMTLSYNKEKYEFFFVKYEKGRYVGFEGETAEAIVFNPRAGKGQLGGWTVFTCFPAE